MAAAVTSLVVNSGDLAYRTHEIVNATAELFMRSQSLKRQAP